MNYGDMKTRIADEIADSTLSSQIILAIKSAIQFYERKEFYFNTKIGTFSTVADQEYYGVAANSDIPSIIKISSANVNVGGYKSPLTAVPFASIDQAQDGTRTYSPETFAYFNQQIRLFPIPNAVYVVSMAYTYRLDALDQDADENAWTNDAEELIRQRAKRLIATDVLRDIVMAQAASALEIEALNALEKETRLRRSVLTLRTDLPTGGRYNIYTDQ